MPVRNQRHQEGGGQGLSRSSLVLFMTSGPQRRIAGAPCSLQPPSSLSSPSLRYGASNLRDFTGQGLVLYLWGMAKLIAAARTSPVSGALGPWGRGVAGGQRTKP